MANRAYLFASDTVHHDAWEPPDDGEYYDSRHTIPFAWWFLFNPEDLRFVDVKYSTSTWQVLRFASDRLGAIDRFCRHRTLLNSIILPHLDQRSVDYFLAVLSAWPGPYLLMDPDEILQDDPIDDAQKILPALTGIKQGTISALDVLHQLRRFSTLGCRATIRIPVQRQLEFPTGGAVLAWSDTLSLAQVASLSDN